MHWQGSQGANDRIGNRTSETRSGITDTYSYTPNAGLPPGHTALLDAVALAGGSGGTRDYTFGPAGHLELLDAGANVLDFGNDVVGQLASVTRTAEHSASFLYDGRGFLREIVTLEPGSGGGGGDLPFLDGFETGDPCEWSTVVGYPGPACPIPPVETRTFVTYDSQGRLRALLPESGDPSYIFTFGDRPIATYTGGPMPSFTWLTTDHLGTPILAIDNAGTALWHGGFEPFGQDYTNPTAASAGVFLRFPGQWTSGAWTDATLGTDLYYNVHRWYETGTGRFSRPDPRWDGFYGDINQYLYAGASPLNHYDVDGQGYQPPPAGGHVANFSDCLVNGFGNTGPFGKDAPIAIPPGAVHVFGTNILPGGSPPLGDVDFVCLELTWQKIRGPVVISHDGRLSGWHRLANPDELKGLPPCTDGPCGCKQP